MTDNEIKKALECHTKEDELCNECPLLHQCNCVGELIRYALDLINRQQADIEQLTINMNAFGLGMKREKENADIDKAEAVKEFAERLKKHIFSMEYRAETKRKTVSIAKVKELIEWILTKVVIDTVDKTVKEMVGDTE